jgi:hypothetical protein
MHEEPLHASAQAAVFGDPAPTTSSATPSIQTAESALGVRKLVVGWSRLIDCVNDLVVVNVSLVDIVCDVLVTIEFYQQRKWAFFWISMLIFLLAQCSYAFLFSATWAKTKGRWGQLAWFFAILPFSQLVPFFAYMETFHMDWLDNSIRWLGLTPTEDLRSAAGATEESLWGYIQSKYQAHAGFLVEAFVEAIPQCVLQTVAIIIYGEASALNILSILISIIVVASKGYLVSYSIDRTTFVFNYLCIVADCFGLIASFTWLFAGSSSDGIRIFEGTADGPTEVWSWLCLHGMGLSCVGGFFLLWFTIFDDHLKTRQPDKYSVNCASVWFEYYLARFVGWCLAIVPVTVVYITSRFALVPIVLLRSLDPEYASKGDFYRPLFEFLQYPHRRRRQQQAQGAGQFEQSWRGCGCACACACHWMPGEQSSLPVAPQPRAVGTTVGTRLPGRQHLSSVVAEDATIDPGPLGAGAGAGAGRHEETLSVTKDTVLMEDRVPMAMPVDNKATAGLYPDSNVQSTDWSVSSPIPGKAIDPSEMKLDCTSPNEDDDEGDGHYYDGGSGGREHAGSAGAQQQQQPGFTQARPAAISVQVLGAGSTLTSASAPGKPYRQFAFKISVGAGAPFTTKPLRFSELRGVMMPLNTKVLEQAGKFPSRGFGANYTTNEANVASRFSAMCRFLQTLLNVADVGVVVGSAQLHTGLGLDDQGQQALNGLAAQRQEAARVAQATAQAQQAAIQQQQHSDFAVVQNCNVTAGAGAGGSDADASQAVQRVLMQHDMQHDRVEVVIPDEEPVGGRSTGRARMTRTVVVPTDLSEEEELALRLKVANQFLLQARRAVPQLTNRLSNLRGSDATRAKRRRVIFIEWLKSVGEAKRAVVSRTWQTEAVLESSVEDDTLASAVAAADLDDAAARAAARRRLRRLNMERKMERAMGAQWANVLSRSAVLTQLLKADAAEGDDGVDDSNNRVNNVLALCGLVCAALVFLIAVAWVPTTAAFLVYGAIYPFIPILQGRCTTASTTTPVLLSNSSSSSSSIDSGSGSAGLELQCALTGIYMFTVCVLCCLAPAVYRFQSLWADLLCVKDFPPVFYTHAREYGVIAELWGRYRDAKDKRAVEKVLDARLGSQLCTYAKKFVAKGW